MIVFGLFREGVKKKLIFLVVFYYYYLKGPAPPAPPPPLVVPRTIYILGPFFWDTESMIAKKKFTLGPIKKSLCFVLL